MDRGSTMQIDEGQQFEGRSRRRVVSLSVVLALSTAAFGLVLGLSALWPEPDRSHVAMPEIGEVVAESIEDDVPIWVVRSETGSVHVLDAVDPALDRGAGPGDAWASDWCPVGRYFEGPWGARFDEHGAYLGGPARHGLTPRAVESIDTDAGIIEVAEPFDEPLGASDEPERIRRSCTATDLEPHPAFEGMNTLSRVGVP